jgi:hypothetical protein
MQQLLMLNYELDVCVFYFHLKNSVVQSNRTCDLKNFTIMRQSR